MGSTAPRVLSDGGSFPAEFFLFHALALAVLAVVVALMALAGSSGSIESRHDDFSPLRKSEVSQSQVASRFR
ncbi:hypothetical protein [Sinorhizobium psoraleae]|uniref:hypothetical protein n=1 Tax=Sinorhizobium psoraleae TaxID=520838 RepID=UPI00156A717F|nr:hypothetical protein [Sinorhizobium psoraleae]